MPIEPLREQLDTLLAEARKNEAKLLRFGQLEQQLMGTRTLFELINIMLCDFRQGFGLDEVRVVLLDETGEWARGLAVHLPLASERGLVLLAHQALLLGLYPSQSPHLGAYQAAVHSELFGSDDIGSVALLPLVRRGNLVGGLHLGSRDPLRFKASSGTYFLERLAAFLVMCLENALYFDKLERFGLTDALTQVNNRRYFDARLKEAVSHALRHRHPLAAMMFDLDHFKQVNDRWGHPVGDMVLQQVAQVIQTVLRGSDSFARYGGEEFVALLPGADKAIATDIAQRILHVIAGHEFRVNAAAHLSLTVSIGVANMFSGKVSSDEATMAKQLIYDADTALYRAKTQGRNCVVVQT